MQRGCKGKKDRRMDNISSADKAIDGLTDNKGQDLGQREENGWRGVGNSGWDKKRYKRRETKTKLIRDSWKNLLILRRE